MKKYTNLQEVTKAIDTSYSALSQGVTTINKTNTKINDFIEHLGQIKRVFSDKKQIALIEAAIKHMGYVKRELNLYAERMAKEGDLSKTMESIRNKIRTQLRKDKMSPSSQWEIIDSALGVVNNDLIALSKELYTKSALQKTHLENIRVLENTAMYEMSATEQKLMTSLSEIKELANEVISSSATPSTPQSHSEEHFPEFSRTA